MFVADRFRGGKAHPSTHMSFAAWERASRRNHAVGVHPQDDYYDDDDDDMEYDHGGMRGMSLALAFMCMLTVTQVFQVTPCRGHVQAVSHCDLTRSELSLGLVASWITPCP